MRHTREKKQDVSNWGKPLRDLLIRGFTDEAMEMLDAAAEASGMSRNEWSKRTLLRAALAPVVRKNYGLKGFADNNATIRIDRYDGNNPDMDVEQEEVNLTDEQEEFYRKAVKLVQRNE